MVSIELDITFFIQAGLFLLLVYILNVLVYKPVLKIMEQREGSIKGYRDDAASIAEEIDRRLAEYRARIEEAKGAGNAERAKLKKEGQDKEVEILSAAHEDAQKSLAEARKRIEREKEKALKILRGMIDEMGRSVAEKELGRSL